MIASKKKFTLGFVMLASFAVVLAVMFTPIFNGQNGLRFLDDMYNSMSKGSAYYIPAVQKEVSNFKGSNVTFSLELKEKARAEQSAILLQKAGGQVRINKTALKINGDLAVILTACLKDSDLMYQNDGDSLKKKYGYDEKSVMYNWHTLLKLMDKNLTKQKNFKEAKVSALVNHKVVETAYNYYGIIAKSVKNSAGVLTFSLIFYVIYTIWYGFGLMFMFEGLGLKFDH